MICAGIDAGSRTLKVVLVEPDGHRIVAAGVRDQGIDQDSLAAQLLDELLSGQGLQRGRGRDCRHRIWEAADPLCRRRRDGGDVSGMGSAAARAGRARGD